MVEEDLRCPSTHYFRHEQYLTGTRNRLWAGLIGSSHEKKIDVPDGI
jgi:hypothetical protein